MKPIRVLIVDDSAFMRKMITDILESDRRIQVVGTARNGMDGINKIKKLDPDVVTMDVNMPVLDGLSALKEIMKNHPVPIIMLASNVGDRTDATIEAMENGAVDFIMKPSGEISLDIKKIQQEIITKVIAAKGATLSRLTSNNEEGRTKLGIRSSSSIQKDIQKQTVITIGTSTGGPRALQQIVTDLPQDFDLPILIVQHMPPVFTKSLADRLNDLTNLHVKEAEHGEIISNNTAYIAPGGFHMKLIESGNYLSIQLTKDEPVHNHRPSVDVMFESIAALNSVNKVAVVLTGMGSDGAKGIQKMKQKDPYTTVITESEKSAVIYGMPKATYEKGLADIVLPLDQIGHYLGTV